MLAKLALTAAGIAMLGFVWTVTAIDHTEPAFDRCSLTLASINCAVDIVELYTYMEACGLVEPEQACETQVVSYAFAQELRR